MRVASSLRNLVRTEASHQQYERAEAFGKTVQQAAREATPLLRTRTPLEERVSAGLPGDSVDLPSNPFLSRNPQETARLVREGRLSAEDSELASQSLRAYFVSTGERTMWSADPDPDPDAESPVGTYAGAGCAVPDRDYFDNNRLQVRPKGARGGRSRPTRSGPEPAYQGVADRLPEHELEYLWR